LFLFPFAAFTMPRSRVTARLFIYRYVVGLTPLSAYAVYVLLLYIMPLTLTP
jgi:hypothetical protein